MENALSFMHRFEPAARGDAPTLLLLHGTGGNEDDLLPLGQMIAPGAALLSPRGQVLEHGMPRFFRRLAEGVFDEADVRRRALDLATFIEEAKARYGIPAPVALGYSNGANIAAALLYLKPEALGGALLLRAMVPLASGPEARADGKPVLILSGAMDPIVPAANAGQLASALGGAGAAVAHKTLPAGHELSQADIRAARDWLASIGQSVTPAMT
jgi:phospholipase/carboxylesterase